MQPAFISVHTADGYFQVLAIVEGNLAIHKDRPSLHGLDYNSIGWIISEVSTGRQIANNDYTPFYEAVNTMLALVPIFSTMPDSTNETKQKAWLDENHSAVKAIVKPYIDW